MTEKKKMKALQKPSTSNLKRNFLSILRFQANVNGYRSHKTRTRYQRHGETLPLNGKKRMRRKIRYFLTTRIFMFPHGLESYDELLPRRYILILCDQSECAS